MLSLIFGHPWSFVSVTRFINLRMQLCLKHLGANVAGARGFYLKGDGVRLNQALIDFDLYFFGEKGGIRLCRLHSS